MVTKMVKTGVVVVVGAALVGGLFLGKDAMSYMRVSARSVQSAVKGSVPIEFELKRASDMLEDIIPEMHANIRLIAQEEVEIAALKAGIVKSQSSIAEEGQRIQKLRTALTAQQPSYAFGSRNYSRANLKVDLAGRFDRYKEAEIILASQERLLNTREQSLTAAMQLLEKTRSEKRLLQDKISALAGQYRVVKASAVGSKLNIDNSKLTQTAKLIAQIEKRLDVAERVLAHESRFVQMIPVDSIEEADLFEQIDNHFNPSVHVDKLTVAKDQAVVQTLGTN
jgi:uncharacterized coiled-coil protein SlyX